MGLHSGGDDPAATITAELQQLAHERAPILQQLSEGVIIADIDGRLVFVNEAAERIHGVKKLDVAPDDYSDTYSLFTMDGEPYPFDELPLARAVARGETVEDARWRIRRPDGSAVIAIGSARPLMTDDRQIGAILNVRDDSERFEAERKLRDSEERLRLVIDGASDYAIFTTDPLRVVTSWSRGAELAFGYGAEEIVGQFADILWTSEDQANERPALEVDTARATGRANDERWHQRQDGSRVFMNGSVHPLPLNEDGSERGFIKIARDETERRAADAALKESEARFRNMADHAPVMMWVTEADGRCTYLNQSWYEFTGQSEKDALGVGWLSAVHPDDSAEADRIFLAANAKHEAFRLEYRLRREDGTYGWAIDAAAPRFDSEGAFLGFIGSVVDIDQRKRAEEVLTARNRGLDLLARISGWLVVETAPDERVQSAFAAIAEEVGADYYFNYLVDADDPSTMRLDSSGGLSSEQEAAFARIPVGEYLCGRVAETRQPVIIADLDRSEDPACGAVIGLDGKCYAGFPLVSAGRLIGTISFAAKSHSSFSEDQVDLMRTVADQAAAALDRGRIVAALSDSEQQFRALAENVSQLAWMAEPDGSIFWYNRRWYEYTGTSAETQEGWGWESVHDPAVLPEVVERWTRSLDSGTEFEMTFPLRGANGVFRPFLTRAVPIRDTDGQLVRWFGTNTDVSAQLDAEQALKSLNETLEHRVTEEVERRTTAEEALRQAQKMEAIGQLTGGIAHDFNNLLQIIAGNLDILQRNLTEASPRLRRSIDNALKGAERAAVLTQRLLAFSRRQPLEPKVIDSNKLVSGMSDMLHRTLGETYSIETVTASGLWRVEADPNQLEGALLNLAINARDAMPDGGKLTIETANTHIDRDYADRHSGVSPGQYVVTCVSDTGSGMDAETAERAVEPFFTTKDVGKGTGLGLSMVYGFVKQSGGHLKIYSEPGQGTTVKIYLPRHHGEESVDAIPAPERALEGADNEIILLCEDDDDVRSFSAETLRELGYRVIEASDGEAALDLLAPERGRIDLLFTDVVLPGITGAVLAERARALRPGLKVLFTTGYARNAIVHHGRLDAGVELLSKPFTYAELSTRIRDLLDAPTAA